MTGPIRSHPRSHSHDHSCGRRHPLTLALLSLGILALALAGAFFVTTGEADAYPSFTFVVQKVEITGEPREVPTAADDVSIEITFNRSVVKSTVTSDTMYIRDRSDGSLVPCEPWFGWQDPKVVFAKLKAPLKENTEYELVLTSGIESEVTDGQGSVPISLEGRSVYFMTTGPPVVTGHQPEHEATGVIPDYPIFFAFNRAMDASTISTDTVRLNEVKTGALVPATIKHGANNVYEIVPDALLKLNTEYRVSLLAGSTNGIKAANGRPLAKMLTWTFTVNPATFPDVPWTHDYFKAIEFLAGSGVISGYEDGKFGLDDFLKRQQFTKILAKAVELDVTGSLKHPFIDVPEQLGDDPLYPSKYVAACAAEGYTQGKTATEFDPWGDITRYQVISMVTRAAKEHLFSPKTPPSNFGKWKNDPTGTHGDNAAWAEYNGLLNGLDLDKLDPWGKMTRGETAQVVYNLMLGTLP